MAMERWRPGRGLMHWRQFRELDEMERHFEDVFEHAFMTDYGLKQAEYITAFLKNINWKVVEGRLK